MKPYLTLDDLKLDGATVLLRLDINSPIVDGHVQGRDRIEASAETVTALAGRGARTVVIAHQGRKGGDDFTSTREHAEIIANVAKAPVSFVPDVAGSRALEAIKGLRKGEAVVLENVRGHDDENRKGTPAALAELPLIRTLAAQAEYFVNDGFSVAHRPQATIVAFPELLPSAAGLTMDRELTALAQAVDAPEEPLVYVLGGAKPEDSIAVMKSNLASGKLSAALLGGLVGELFLVARGHELGPATKEVLQRKKVLDLLPQARDLLDAYDDAIYTPEDVAVKGASGVREELWIDDLPAKGVVLDIGRETMATYREIVVEAGSLMMNGPMGFYEEAPFDEGTRALLGAFAETDAFSLMGGGHTVSAIRQFGHAFDEFGYVSLAGGALMAYLTGEELPGVAALKRSAARVRGG
ncbi:MAG TPA: phosphoglycerate kinase [Candidatus Thermoplasmatota archaeon]|nr:phosphoglycerate kinase [Candidatus Thermoplasmatota archaeon]